MAELVRLCSRFRNVSGIKARHPELYPGMVVFNGQFEHPEFSAFSIRFKEDDGRLDLFILHRRNGRYDELDHGRVEEVLDELGFTAESGPSWHERVGVEDE